MAQSNANSVVVVGRVYTPHTSHSSLHVRVLGVVFPLSGHRENISSREECRGTGGPSVGRAPGGQCVLLCQLSGNRCSTAWTGKPFTVAHIPPHPVNGLSNESNLPFVHKYLRSE